MSHGTDETVLVDLDWVAKTPQVGDEVVLVAGQIRYHVLSVAGTKVLADREETVRGAGMRRTTAEFDGHAWADFVTGAACVAKRVVG